MGESHRGATAWNKGIPMREESRRKLSETQKANPPSFEKRKRMSDYQKKRMANPEVRKRLSEFNKKRMSNPENRERSRKTLLKLYDSGKFPRQENTKPERQIKEELIKREYKEGIDFIHQFKFMNKFMCDFCFPLQKVIVEVDGDFWHANPDKYSQDKLHKHQIKGIARDKSKNAYITKVDNGSWTLLRFWESDINKNVIQCADRIEEVLNNKKYKSPTTLPPTAHL
jgi:DNA mismatch endonuclease (patch repair protein)